MNTTETLADMMREGKLLGSAQLSALSSAVNPLRVSLEKQLSTLSQSMVDGLSGLGEELLNPRAELSTLSSEPGAGLRVLSKRQAQQAGAEGGRRRAEKQSKGKIREIAMLGVEARKRKRAT